MKNKNYIYQELKEISPLILQIRKTNVYSVSEFYFNDLSGEIIKKINLAKELHSHLSPLIPYSIPKGYFEGLPHLILQRVYQNSEPVPSDVFEEMEEIAPILNTISKKPVQSIPPNFFSSVKMPAGIKPEAKVVPISKRPKFSRLFAAAVITSFLAIGLYTITGKDFITFRSNNNAKSEVKTLSKEEIVSFLKTSPSSENITSAMHHTCRNENAIKSSLKEISDNEIQQFLQETGESDGI